MRWRAQEFHADAVPEGTDHSCIIVGLHPDEATEAIVDVALRTGAAFAVVPCCVFPSLFAWRRLENGGDPRASGSGDPVVSYDDFCTYLQQKVHRAGRRCDMGFLNLQGKNRVLFSRAEDRSTSTLANAQA